MARNTAYLTSVTVVIENVSIVTNTANSDTKTSSDIFEIGDDSAIGKSYILASLTVIESRTIASQASRSTSRAIIIIGCYSRIIKVTWRAHRRAAIQRYIQEIP